MTAKPAAEPLDVPAQDLVDARPLLDHEDLGGAAADGLEADRPHAGEEIEHASALEPLTEHAEHRLLDAAEDRARGLVAGDGLQRS